MTSFDIPGLRLYSQRIEGKKCKTSEEVVRWMGAIQAQDYLQALWAIGVRTQDTTALGVEQAIADKKIVRTWPIRGTIHFVPAEDAKWMVKLSAERMIAGDKRRQTQLGLDEKILEQSGRIFYDALQGGKALSRPAMMKLLEDAGITPKGQRGYHILWYLAQTGLLCGGPHEGKQQTFALLDEWAPQAKELSREEALAELARRYFTSHGPATMHDFAWWSGLTLADAKAGLAFTTAKLASQKIDAKEYWMSINAADHSASGVHLLPGFDEYLLGYKDRSDVLAAEHARTIVPGGNGVFAPMLVVNGQIVGTWRRTIKKNAVHLVLVPFQKFGKHEEAAVKAAKRYSDFLGLPLLI